MKIAITTWYGGFNSGTFFQLYGLYSYLRKRGHEIEVIKYKSQKSDFLPKGALYYITQLKNGLIKKIKSKKETEKISKIARIYDQDTLLKNNRFSEMYSLMKFTQDVITEDDFDKLNSQFDAFIVGSDQVWNATSLNRRYFLDYVHPDKIKAAYAPSVGTGYVFKKAIDNYKKYLSDFKYIAAREKKLQYILNEILPIPVEHVLDPSMLIPKSEYEDMAHYPLDIPKGSYILCYFMPENKIEEEKVRKYAKEHSLKIVIMTMSAYSYSIKDTTIYASAGPKEFLGLIANAAVVMTSSFHCTIFSILFNKDVYVFEHLLSGKSADISLRYKEQLETYGMSHRLIHANEDIDGDHIKPIDYDKVNKIFNERLKKSQEFLNQFC